jgi:AcrR family transcriptional regulator
MVVYAGSRMTRVTQAHIDARMQDILGAAARVFAARGSEGTTMQEIAREAGISAGAIYRYYPSKADLLMAVCEAKTATVAAVFADAAQEAGSPLATLTTIGSRLAAAFGEEGFDEEVMCHLEATLAGARDPDGLGVRVRETVEVVCGALEGLVREAQTAGEIQPGIDPRALAAVLDAFVVGLRQMYLSQRDELDVPGAFEALGALLRLPARAEPN